MLRIFKMYDFDLQNPDVHSKSMRLSSRPGHIESWDDFYTMESNLTVFETSLECWNNSLY